MTTTKLTGLLQTVTIAAALPLTARAALDTNRIAQITGLPGTWSAAEGVFKVTAPRNDLPVSVDGWKMPPFMGLTSWAGFVDGKKEEAMIMGDLVLLETNGPRIFVNVPDAKQVAVIDREKKDLGAKWLMEKFQANFPMALDEGNRRLFVGCRSPARLAVLDTTSGKLVSDLVIVGDTDDLFYDAKRKMIYVSGGEGFVDVIEQGDADHYQRRARIPTRAGARTSFFCAELDEFYLAVPQRGDLGAEIRCFQP